MKKVMLVGANEREKNLLISHLSGNTYKLYNAMAVEYYKNFVNIPSTFLQNRRFYSAIVTTAASCDILLFLQSAHDHVSYYQPNFSNHFNKNTYGIITKVNEEAHNTARAQRFLALAGMPNPLFVDYNCQEHLLALRNILQ